MQASSAGLMSAAAQADALTIAAGPASHAQDQAGTIHPDASAAKAIFICVAWAPAPVAHRGVECCYGEGGPPIKLWRGMELSYRCRKGARRAPTCAPDLF